MRLAGYGRKYEVWTKYSHVACECGDVGNDVAVMLAATIKEDLQPQIIISLNLFCRLPSKWIEMD